jgi:hypothetical protein
MLTTAHRHANQIQSYPGGLCMRGRIYSDQKCPICGGQLIHDDRRRGLFCENHPQINKPTAGSVSSSGERPVGASIFIGRLKGF